jgi:hypothetical protein
MFKVGDLVRYCPEYLKSLGWNVDNLFDETFTITEAKNNTCWGDYFSTGKNTFLGDNEKLQLVVEDTELSDWI